MRRKLTELFGRWESALSQCLSEAQARGQVAGDRDVVELAATLIEAWEGAVMRGRRERHRRPYQRFESVVLPRLLT